MGLEKISLTNLIGELKLTTEDEQWADILENLNHEAANANFDQTDRFESLSAAKLRHKIAQEPVGFERGTERWLGDLAGALWPSRQAPQAPLREAVH